MKKRIIIPLILLLTTGCTCEYNLTIDNDVFKEEVILTGETSQEISQFDNEWQIPIDKEEYALIVGADTEYIPEGESYKYNLTSNKLIFNHDFSKKNYKQSTAVSNCYNKLTLTNYDNTIVISTSPKVDCFDKYPMLNNIKITIIVDREVISNNADSINDNKYIWNINKNNVNNKSINLILKNNELDDDKEQIPSIQKNNKTDKSYELYILLLIIVIVVFIGYKWFIKFKEKNNDID